MATPQFRKLHKKTLVEDFITHFEEMILSGRLTIGEKLPSERDLAAQLEVSRPVVHEGLINLASKGLITRGSSGGAVVNDYRKDGSLHILNSLFGYQKVLLDPAIARSTLDFRLLVEVENARLAARNRMPEQLTEMEAVLEQERAAGGELAGEWTDLDFKLHHIIALASGNLFYPLLLNSCKVMYMSFVAQFYEIPGVHAEVLAFHQALVDAIARQDEDAAGGVMASMLEHGSRKMTEVIFHRT